MGTVVNRGRMYFLLGEVLQPHRLSSGAGGSPSGGRLVRRLMFD
jgi:hypothetical protein